MSIHRPNPRRDSNEPEIVAAFEAAGCQVEKLSGKGTPDLLVLMPDGKTLALCEIKTATGKLTDDQTRWHNHWRGTVYIVRTVEQALDVVEWLR